MATYTLTDGTRKTKLTINGDTTVVFPTKLDYFGVRSLDGADILVSKIKAPTALEDGVYSTDEGDGDVVVDDGIFTDTLYLKGSGTVVVYGGAKPNHLPFKVGSKGGGGDGSKTSYRGTTTTAISNGSTTNPITIDGEDYTAVFGDIVVYNYTEFIFDGTTWSEFGRPFDTTPTSGSANAVTSDGIYTFVNPYRTWRNGSGATSAIGGAVSYNTASGIRSLAWGDVAKATGVDAIAIGKTVTASGSESLALGLGTAASQPQMIACGKYNAGRTNDLLEIGNGSSDNARSNIVEVNSSSLNVNGDIQRNGVGIDDYTTTERLIGKWIDGSDLYQRTYEVTSGLTTGSWNDNVLDTPGIDIKAFDGYIRYLYNDEFNRNIQLNYYVNSTDYVATQNTGSDLSIKPNRTERGLTIDKAIITIKYTKVAVQANVQQAETRSEPVEEPIVEDDMR